jgi:hypothetical protein
MHQVVTMDRSSDNDTRMPAIFVVIGVLLSVFGGALYFLVPAAFLGQNLKLMFTVFLAVLIGLLFGLVLMALNAQPLLERGLSFLLFGILRMENRCLPIFVDRNLDSHRARNRKTSIMYALSLGFVIFLTVIVRVEINTMFFEYA